MAKRHKHDEARGDAHDESGAGHVGDTDGSALQRLSRMARRRPVTTLALAAGVGALMGAELLAAGLAGGAAVLLLQRGDLRGRAERVLDRTRQRISDGVRTIEERQERHV